jgi:hypothetical protein
MKDQEMASDDSDFYSEKAIQNLLEEDEISLNEEAFMIGYIKGRAA